jgi:hypothetical protein
MAGRDDTASRAAPQCRHAPPDGPGGRVGTRPRVRKRSAHRAPGGEPGPGQDRGTRPVPRRSGRGRCAYERWNRPARQRRVALRQGTVTDADEDLVGFDAAALVETIEHVDPAHLSRLEHSLFSRLRPGRVVITTPNREYNRLYGMKPGEMRHPDHRFEWDRESSSGGPRAPLTATGTKSASRASDRRTHRSAARRRWRSSDESRDEFRREYAGGSHPPGCGTRGSEVATPGSTRRPSVSNGIPDDPAISR